MATLNLSTNAIASGVFDHPVAPGSKYGFNVVDAGAAPGHDMLLSSTLSTITDDSLKLLLKCDDVKEYINGLITVPVGYDMETEFNLTITEAPDLKFKTYMDEHNRSVSVDVTTVNLYVNYTITVTKDDDMDYQENITKVILFVLTA